MRMPNMRRQGIVTVADDMTCPIYARPFNTTRMPNPAVLSRMYGSDCDRSERCACGTRLLNLPHRRASTL